MNYGSPHLFEKRCQKLKKRKNMKRKISFNIKEKEYSFEENTDLVNQLFLALGATLAEIQIFESHIIFLLGGIKSKKKNIDIKEVFEKDESKTLGVLINDLIHYIEDEEVKDLLKIIKDDRNYIVHKILRKYEWPVMSESTYQYAIKEIIEIKESIHKSTPLISQYIQSRKILDLIDIDVLIEKIDH